MITKIRKLIFITTLIFNVFTGLAQNDSIAVHPNKLDSITSKFRKDSAHLYRFQKIRPYLNFDNRNSVVTNVPVNVRGFQLGAVLYRKHTTGLGFYTIKDKSSINVKSIFDNQDVLITTRLNYFTTFYQYALVAKRFFEIDIPIETGIGKFNINTKSEDDEHIVLQKKGWFAFVGTGIKTVIKPVKHIGISGIIGYRFVEDIFTNINFNGLYYSVGVWVDIRQIYRDIRFYGFMRPKYHKALKN
ncbi:MAG: hypothetical protein SFY56_06985 [Bacteroidota bacterium]|nr:hypothetical protein [Bacteroidota bacterium]